MTWKDLATRVWAEMQEDEVFGRAAQLAYYFLLALFPLLLFLVSLLGYFAGENSELRADLFNYLSTVLPGEASKLVTTTIQDVTEGSGGGKLSFGILAALWAASNGMGAISEALNVAYDVKETRPWWKERLVSVGLTVALAVLIISALVLVLYGHDIAEAVAGRFGLGSVFETAWKVLQWPLVLAFVLLAFALIYYLAPSLEHTHWQYVTPGAVIGVALWILVSFGFRTYLQYFNSYSATYGSLGAVIILMLWFYLTGAAILIGGEVNSEIEHAAAEAGDPEAKEPGEKSPGDKTGAAGRGAPIKNATGVAPVSARNIVRAVKTPNAGAVRTRAGESADRSLSLGKVAVVAGAWALSKIWRGSKKKR
ncbi:MAG: YihY/virulence factor BrkB family protein [Pyrinomonadaceae bacterium]